MARILGDGERQKTRAFSELQSHYLFAEKFGRPGKGNDKGKVEDLGGLCAAELHGADSARVELGRTQRASAKPIAGSDVNADCGGTRKPSVSVSSATARRCCPCRRRPFEACEKVTARVSSLSLVRYRANDYSVPTDYGHRQVLVKGYVHQVVIVCGSEVIASHPRSYDRENAIFDPLHYLALLEQKTRALDQAAPLAGWELPDCFSIRRLLEARLSKHGQPRVCPGAAVAGDLRSPRSHRRRRRRSASGHDHLRCRAASAAVPHRAAATATGPGKCPHLPLAKVRTTQAGDYMALLQSSTCTAPRHGGGTMSDLPEMPTPDTPQVLLEHHLKALRLPTFLREYDKVARAVCRKRRWTIPRYLLRMTELELLDRDRRATERRIHQARFPVVKSLDSFDFLAIPSLNKTLVLELARCEFLSERKIFTFRERGSRDMMHITLGWRQFTIVGIRFMGSRYESSRG